MNSVTNCRLTDCTEAFAVPGESNIIDVVNPETKLSWIGGYTLDQIRQRYPDAVIVNISDWAKERSKEQDTPVEWIPVEEHVCDDAHGELPPECHTALGFLVGEPTDHHLGNGLPRFQAYIKRGATCFASSRPMTILEFKQLK